MELIELYSDLLLARFGLIESMSWVKLSFLSFECFLVGQVFGSQKPGKKCGVIWLFLETFLNKFIFDTPSPSSMLIFDSVNTCYFYIVSGGRGYSILCWKYFLKLVLIVRHSLPHVNLSLVAQVFLTRIAGLPSWIVCLHLMFCLGIVTREWVKQWQHLFGQHPDYKQISKNSEWYVVGTK